MNALQNATQEIIRLHGGIAASMRRSVADAIRIGEILAGEKEQLDHGKFLPWLSTLPFSERTAQNYMALFRYKDKTATVADLQTAYRQIESLEAAEKRAEEARKDAMIDEYLRTGKKPDGWDKGMDAECRRRKEVDDIRRRTAEAAERNKAEHEARTNPKPGFDAQSIFAATDRIIESLGKREAFKEDIRLSHEGKADPFVDAIMDYLETLGDDNRKIEACYNIIKVCKRVANELQGRRA